MKTFKKFNEQLEKPDEIRKSDIYNKYVKKEKKLIDVLLKEMDNPLSYDLRSDLTYHLNEKTKRDALKKLIDEVYNTDYDNEINDAESKLWKMNEIIDKYNLDPRGIIFNASPYSH